MNTTGGRTAKEAYEEELERDIEGILERGKLDRKTGERRLITPAMRESLRKLELYHQGKGHKLTTMRNQLREARDLGLWLMAEKGHARYEEAGGEDLEKYMASMYKRPLSSRTLARNVIRTVYWLLEGSGKGKKKVVPEKAELEPPKDDGQDLNPAKVPYYLEAEKHVKAMIEALDHPRDRAIVALCFDSGARKGELAGLRIRDLALEREYGRCTLEKSKTTYRAVVVTRAVPYIQTWMAMHPTQGEPDASLWVAIGNRTEGQPLGRRGLEYVITRAAERAGVPWSTHDLRHARATECAQLGWNETKMRQFFGWKRKSLMPSVYTHIIMADVDRQVLEDAGLEEAEEREPVWRAWTCARCAEINEGESPLCKGCNLARDADVGEALAEGREQRERLESLETRFKRTLAALEEIIVNPEAADQILDPVWLKGLRAKKEGEGED